MRRAAQMMVDVHVAVPLAQRSPLRRMFLEKRRLFMPSWALAGSHAREAAADGSAAAATCSSCISGELPAKEESQALRACSVVTEGRDLSELGACTGRVWLWVALTIP